MPNMKSRWNHFKTKFGDRRPSQCSYSSDTASVRTCESSNIMPDKFLSGLFRRRGSNTSLDMILDVEKETERLTSLYEFAVDEVNYAEDSLGSSYYAGDLETAREAIEECAGAYIQLFEQVSDSVRDNLKETLLPKLLALQEKYTSLPEVVVVSA
ncbi:hypothetical protein EC973_008465 [Apophysomyces ossiformis]|uniref:Uncharacterized protein n=1 Tax=Apophysomyces ossiformis TaxID=679940 RepID=A0A8H7BSW6_9FUNG|nr:hypothetical protein EC973_008465 [Apophysomyces ossiformis]